MDISNKNIRTITKEGNPEGEIEKNKRRTIKPSDKIIPVRIKGDIVTINASSSSYAEILWKIKTEINPDINRIRKTKAGNVLVEMTKGDSQAQNLESAVKGSLGQEVLLQAVKEK